jgi:predicted secreted protein
MKSTIALFALAALIGLSCSDKGTPLVPLSTLQLNASVDGKMIPLNAGQSFTLTLDSWGDAGYLWECQIEDTLIVCQAGGPEYRSSNPGTVGGLWIATFTFSADHAGQTVVTLAERRPWIKNEPPRATVTFTVYVLE